MKIYNTLSKKIEDFIPHNKNYVTMYTCGPTVYHFAHIGNLRTYISEDILEKSLNFLGYNVKRCMNITDVGHLVGDGDTGEDKMLVATKRENKSSYEIADYYTECFKNDCQKLNIKWPEMVSKATDNIDEYINMINKLIKDEYAYISNGNVYFDTSKYNKYYELSGRKSEELLIAVREDINKDEAKKNPFDFGLWFTNSKFNNQELQWDSPWGRGYPGWHIECSNIAIKYLGEYLDIHCGAEDAVFPHHTNEIAQSEAYLGHKWCNYWVHLAFLNDETGKMSKSKGEFLTISLLEKKGYNPIAYRFLCLQSNYRKQMVFSYENLNQATDTYNKLINKINIIKNNANDNIDDNIFNLYINKFKDAINNDLNTSLMLTCLYDCLKEDTTNNTKIKIITEYDKVLSLNLLENIKKEINNDLKNYIENKIKERNEAKANKNYEKADLIRNELENKGILIKDTREGTIYEVK